MLGWRLVHGDMKITNFLQAEKNLVVLDLDATRRVPRADRYATLFHKDLRRLLANWQNSESVLVRQAMQQVVDRARRSQRQQL